DSTDVRAAGSEVPSVKAAPILDGTGGSRKVQSWKTRTTTGPRRGKLPVREPLGDGRRLRSPPAPQAAPGCEREAERGRIAAGSRPASDPRGLRGRRPDPIHRGVDGPRPEPRRLRRPV